MIQFYFPENNDQKLIAFFEQSTPRIMDAVEKAINLAMADLQAYIQRDKLQGQVLKSHKNGAGLAGSINVRFERDSMSIGGYVGTSIVYAKIHEYGFNGSESVRAYTQTRTQAFGNPTRPYTVNVRNHERLMVMPARPYMRPSLEEKKEAIVQRVRDAITEALKAA